MSFNDASTACRLHLSAMADLPPVGYENANFTPEVGVLHLTEKTLFTSSEGLLMNGALQQNEFIYQVMVYAPKSQSVHKAQQMADKVIKRFERGQRLTRNAVKVEIHKAVANASFTTDTWYVQPISVYCVFYA